MPTTTVFRSLYDALLRAVESLDVEQGTLLLARDDVRSLLRNPAENQAPLLPELCAQDDPSTVPENLAKARRQT